MSRQNLKDKVYMRCAFNIAELSKDENTHVGAKIIGADGSPISEGRNGASRNMPSGRVPYSREKVTLHVRNNRTNIFQANKYPFMIHAEENAILFTDNISRLSGATMYVTHMPCPPCASKISQVGIKRVVCPKGSLATMTDEESIKITEYIFKESQIEYVEIDMD